MIGGLDTILITIFKSFILPVLVDPVKLFIIITPTGLVASKILERKIKERGRR